MPSRAIAGSFGKQHIASIFQPGRAKRHYWFSVLSSEIIWNATHHLYSLLEYFKYFTQKLKTKQKNELNKQKTDTNNKKKTERRHLEIIWRSHQTIKCLWRIKYSLVFFFSSIRCQLDKHLIFSSVTYADSRCKKKTVRSLFQLGKNVLPVLCWFKRVFHRACLCERTKVSLKPWANLSFTISLWGDLPP